jgi:hypothetical protein
MVSNKVMGINTTKFPLPRDDQTDQYKPEREENFMK